MGNSLKGTIILDQSEPGSNGNERVTPHWIKMNLKTMAIKR